MRDMNASHGHSIQYDTLMWILRVVKSSIIELLVITARALDPKYCRKFCQVFYKQLRSKVPQIRTQIDFVRKNKFQEKRMSIPRHLGRRLLLNP